MNPLPDNVEGRAKVPWWLEPRMQRRHRLKRRSLVRNETESPRQRYFNLDLTVSGPDRRGAVDQVTSLIDRARGDCVHGEALLEGWRDRGPLWAPMRTQPQPENRHGAQYVRGG
jgi:hypothetical protein